MVQTMLDKTSGASQDQKEKGELMKFQYRHHRGGLAESMETLQVFHSFKELIDHLNKDLKKWVEKDITEDMVAVCMYLKNPDKRIGWKQTYGVSVVGLGAVGFADEPKRVMEMVEKEESKTTPKEHFIVKHYGDDPHPTIKGNGFDGLVIGEYREEAEDFIKFVNSLMIGNDELQTNIALIITEHIGNTTCAEELTKKIVKLITGRDE
jgi:hypothetical protein